MKKYTPNFNDPRVQRKCTDALQWATCMLKENKANSWSRTHLDVKIGYSHTSLGAWLRHNLLTTTNPRFSTTQGIAKQYVLNTPGAVKIAQHLGIEYNPHKPRESIGVRTAVAKYAPQFAATEFVYTNLGDRYYNDMQNIKTDIRKQLFSHYGFRFNYDCENAYPTIMLQYAHNWANFRKPFSALIDYTQNTREYRTRLATHIGCDYATAKEILVAKFNGATLRPRARISQLLTREQLHRLKHSTQFQELCKDITRLWQGIARSHCQSSIRPRQRMQMYQHEERRVQNAVVSLFNNKAIKVFLEHDGWRATDYIDVHLIELHIRKRTGYSIRISVEIAQ